MLACYVSIPHKGIQGSNPCFSATEALSASPLGDAFFSGSFARIPYRFHGGVNGRRGWSSGRVVRTGFCFQPG